MIRRWSLMLIVMASGSLSGTGRAGDDAAVAERMARVREIHGAAGPWAVAGYRMGERALKELGLPRHAFSLRVVHRCPAQVQYSCIADGLQAATGASPGKLNLRVEEATAEAMRTVIRDEKTGRELTFTPASCGVRPVLVVDLSPDRREAEGRRVAELPEDAIFRVSESK